MSDTTAISWTDSTFNPWWGCTKIAPGCDNCYAAALDHRTGGNYWDEGISPRVTSLGNWSKPTRWDLAALKENKYHKVFCGSMCDVFDKNARAETREDLFRLIKSTTNLEWQLLTKRAPNISKYLPQDWGSGYDNVWLGVTVENKQHGLPRIDILRKIPAKIRFLSVEPLLEDIGEINLNGIHWVIVGGESGNGYRKMETKWALNVMEQCRKQSVPFFFKQHGGTSKDKGGSKLGGIEIKEWPHNMKGAK